MEYYIYFTILLFIDSQFLYRNDEAIYHPAEPFHSAIKYLLPQWT